MKSGRYCGDCTACCTALGVPELGKEHGAPCVHEGNGCCSKYKERPGSCQKFDCLWLQGSFDVTERPKQLGIVMVPSNVNKAGKRELIAYEAFDGAFDQPAGRDFLKKLSKDTFVIMVRKQERYFIGPTSVVKEYASKFRLALRVYQFAE